MRIADGVFWMAGRDPNKTALRLPAMANGEKEVMVPYRLLAENIIQIGKIFRAMGGQHGDMIALYLQNSIEYLELFLGLAHAGCIVAPLNPRLPQAENEVILSKMKPWRVITEDKEGFFIGSSLSDEKRQLLQIPSPFNPHMTEVENSNCPTYAEFHDEVNPTLSDTDLFYIGYSSGTTGQPKGILRTHKSWTESFFGMTLEFNLGSQTVMLVPGPFCYSASLIAALHILFIGGTVEIQRHFDAHRTAYRLAHSDINAIFMVPTMYQDVLDVCSVTPQLSTNKPFTCITAGDTMSRATRQAWSEIYPNARLYEYFGSSEVGFVSVLASDNSSILCAPSRESSSTLRTSPIHTLHANVGRPFFPVRIRVINTEIQVKSNLGFAGYAGEDDELEHQVKRGNGWLAPGDTGFITSDGYLHLTGRNSDLIICGGVNLYPTEIEQVILQYEDVREVCVLGIADQRLGQVPVCVVVWANIAHCEHSSQFLTPITDLDFLTYLNKHLAGYKRPHKVFQCISLPRNASGKVLKQQLLIHLQKLEY